MKEPIIEGAKSVRLVAGSNVMSIVFKGRDGIFKAAMFDPFTGEVPCLIEMLDSSKYRGQKDDEITMIFSTVLNDPDEPLTPNGVALVELPAPFWESIGNLIGEQFEYLTDLQAINAVRHMIINISKHVKAQDPSIEIFEKQNKEVDIAVN